MAKRMYEVISTEQMVYYHYVEAESEEEVQQMIDDDELPDHEESDCVFSMQEISAVVPNTTEE